MTENEQLRVQARALARKITQGREGEGEGEGEMQEDTEVEEDAGENVSGAGRRKEDVERENKALKSDVRFLQEKVRPHPSNTSSSLR